MDIFQLCKCACYEKSSKYEESKKEFFAQLETVDVNIRESTYKGETLLMTACNYGGLEVVKKLLEKKADINLLTTNYTKQSALSYAVYHNKYSPNIDIIIELIKNGACLFENNFYKFDVLTELCSSENYNSNLEVTIIKAGIFTRWFDNYKKYCHNNNNNHKKNLTFDYQSDKSGELLHIACSNKIKNLAQLFIDLGAQVNYWPAFDYGANNSVPTLLFKNNWLDLLELVFDKICTWDAVLYSACGHKEHTLVSYLIDRYLKETSSNSINKQLEKGIFDDYFLEALDDYRVVDGAVKMRDIYRKLVRVIFKKKYINKYLVAKITEYLIC